MTTHYHLLKHYLGWRPFHRYNVPLLQWVKLNTPSKPHDTPHLILQKKFGGWLVECFTSPSMVRMMNRTTHPAPFPKGPFPNQLLHQLTAEIVPLLETTNDYGWENLRNRLGWSNRLICTATTKQTHPQFQLVHGIPSCIIPLAAVTHLWRAKSLALEPLEKLSWENGGLMVVSYGFICFKFYQIGLILG